MKHSEDYDQGQMMGMLVLIRLVKEKKHLSAELLDKIERIATESLAEYFDKPSEDVALMVDKHLSDL